ncbi:unnamed protein product [Cochlearia groenlandica]
MHYLLNLTCDLYGQESDLFEYIGHILFKCIGQMWPICFPLYELQSDRWEDMVCMYRPSVADIPSRYKFFAKSSSCIGHSRPVHLLDMDSFSHIGHLLDRYLWLILHALVTSIPHTSSWS